MEMAVDRLLPNFRIKAKSKISSLILRENREQDEIEKLGSREKPLLPKTEIREQIREQIIDSDSVLPNSDSLPPNSDSLPPNSDSVLPNLGIREQINSPLSITETSLKPLPVNKKLLPNSEIREQIENGNTIAGKSIVKVKGTSYILTHAKSNKYMPEHKGWLEIKTSDKKLYLYLRWRDGEIQRSRCMGKLDRLS
jgi:hypothetical protein